MVVRALASCALAGLGMVLGMSAPMGAHAPTPPQVIPEDAFHNVTLPPATRTPIVVDPYIPATMAPRPVPPLPAAEPIAVPVATPKPKAPQLPSTSGMPTVADAKAYARSVLGATQYSCLDQIAIKESNWNPYDLNRTSGAYGIPQALPGSKMAWAGDDWRTNPVTQVRWMIHYVNGRYGSACAAWAFWVDNRWY